MSRFIRRTKRPTPFSYPPAPPDPSSWTVAAARAFAQACAMGLVLPWSALYPSRDREENR
jgi:hypothetical protein